MKNVNPTKTSSWKKLEKHFLSIKNVYIKDFFNKDHNRFNNFSFCFENQILFDLSKNIINQETINILINLAKECKLNDAIYSMFHAKNINKTENKPVLYFALRKHNNLPIIVNKKDIMQDINSVLNKMETFCNKVISGSWRGFDNKKITDIVNIGIGGSHLGPNMVNEALREYKNHLKIHYLSNLDSSYFKEIITKLNPSTTLFLVSSKSFLTEETMTNLNSIISWFLSYAKNKKYISQHFIALTSNIKQAQKLGISIIFQFWDYVPGRYSLWSSIGLSIALSIGFNNFKKLLNGAYAMDKHFINKPFSKNIPILLALISIWYSNFFKTETEAVLTYDKNMSKFIDFLQQIHMESNGKSIDRNGNRINYQTSNIIWGKHGIHGQHSFYQLMHQGTKIVPCDFIITVNRDDCIYDHHIKLFANFFSQTKILAFGKYGKLKTNKFKLCMGNKPSNSILINKLTPYNLGALIATYEHKVFVQGVILNIYSFDQYGVEASKKLSQKMISEIITNNITKIYDSSTNGLINKYKQWKKNI